MKKDSADKFKPFWVKSVNGWLCDASYSGKDIKNRNPTPPFRKFYFIRSLDALNGFRPHEGVSNEDLVRRFLENDAAETARFNQLMEGWEKQNNNATT